MNSDKYSLTWQTYSDHLRTMMTELMMNEDYADVTLVTEDKKQIKAHMNILSACSPVFKDIMPKVRSLNAIIYLKGIHFSEIEAIMQFIYLGEATFYEERINEVLTVAKSLEIKTLYNSEVETNESNFESSTLDLTRSNEELEEPPVESNHMKREERKKIFGESKYVCEQCSNIFNSYQGLITHKRSRHETNTEADIESKYVCEQCPNTYNSRQGLHQHKKSRHETITEVKTNDEPNYKSSHVDHAYIEEDKPAVESNNINFEEIEKRSVQKKYLCELCDKTYNTRQGLHFHSKHTHEGIKYVCNQCDFKAKHHVTLKTHIKSEHEGIEYACNQCEYRCKWKKNVRLHTIKMH